MNHSMEAYLERLSTDSLYGLIRYCTSVEETSFYEEEVRIAHNILLNRERQSQQMCTNEKRTTE